MVWDGLYVAQIIILPISKVDGVFLSMISFALPVIQQFWNLSPLQAGALGSIIFLGMMIGNIILK